MNRYNLYKESGISWLGNIPSNWDVTRNKYFTIPIQDKSETGTEELLSVSEKKGVIPRRSIRNEEEHLSTSKTLVGYLKVLPGDLVSNIMLMWKRGLGVSDLKGIVSPSYSVFRFINSEPKYYHYLFRTDQYVSEFRRNSTGVIESRLRLYDDSFGFMSSHRPPLSEQQQIVSFLDDKTQKIDSLIQQKEKKIELLKEKKTSLINLIVTKGLDSNVEMKDSGVEWIGKIPSHWGSSKLGFYTTKIGSGSTPRGGSEVYVDSGIPFIRSQNVHFNGLRLDGVSYIKYEVHHSMKGSTVVKEDVLLNITGGSIGRCCIVNVDGEMNVNQHVSIIRTTSKLKNHFLNYILSCDLGQSQVRFNMSGGNREGLTIEGIRDFQITLPPISEQEQIVKYLDKQTEEIDTLIQLEQKKIETLQEYRQSLISEVVTGKIRVCEEDNSLSLNSQIV